MEGSKMKKLFFALVFIFALGFINILFSEQPVPPDDGVGGSSGTKLGHWEYYGDYTQPIACSSIEIIYDPYTGLTTVKFVVKQGYIIWGLEKCDPGGSACTVRTERKTYKGSICG
jgi:hypothetical protein